MAKDNSILETGVDKLVELIKSKKRISIQNAAKQLGVSPVVVEEWSDFLEEEGIISIEYKFTTPYLVERKLSDKEVKEKEKEFHSKKEGFVRKAEVTLAILDREGEYFQSFKEKFEKLKKELGSELVHVEAEIKQMEKFEDMKNNIDKQITEQDREFRKRLVDFDNEIKREEQRYKDIIEGINIEEERLDKERLEGLSLREKEMNIKKRLDQFKEYITQIEKSIKDDDDIIENASKNIKNLKKLSQTIKKSIENKKKKSQELVKMSKDHKDKISTLQQEILDKVAKKKAEIDKQIEDSKLSTKKFRSFFKKKVEVENLIKDIDKQKDELEQELISLIKKSKAYHISTKSAEFKNHTKELEKTFNNIKSKKQKFDQETSKLSSMMKS